MAVFPWLDPKRTGPGVRPDAPRKTGAARWFEIIGRDFGALWLSGALALLALLPYVLGLSFAVTGHLPLVVFLAGVAGGALAGPFLCAVADLWLRGARDEPILWRHAWVHALRRNWRQSLVPGAVCGTVVGMQLFALYHLAPGPAALPMLVLLLLGLVLAFAFMAWLWAQLPLFEMGLGQLLKNSLLLALGHLLPSLAAAALGLLYLGALLLLAPLSLLALPVTNLWLPVALLLGPIYQKLDATFDLEASIRALHEEQE